MTAEELEALKNETEEYASLLTVYNYNKERFNLLVRSILRTGVDLQTIIQSLTMAFNIDNASGAQLDVIGSLIGIERLLSYAPTTGSREMDDDEYRLALKLTVAKNTWDGTLGSLGKIYRDALGEDVTFVYIDNQDMSVDIDVYGDISTRETEMLENAGLLLVPVGVAKSVSVIGGDADTEIFAGVEPYSIEQIECVIAS